MDRRPRLAITLGDPCGIGPELLLRSLPLLQSWADLTVIGSRAGLDLLRDNPAIRGAWRWGEAPAAAPPDFRGEACGLGLEGSDGSAALWLDPTPEVRVDQLELGRGSAFSGHAAVAAIRIGAEVVLGHGADALVTLPMAKSAAHLAGHGIPGHTEYLQSLTGAPLVRMAFVSPRLSVVLHTVHQSLRSVVEGLDAGAVTETLTFAADRFSRLTGNPGPRVALCALNPHAGEGGAFGLEEAMLKEALADAAAAFRNGNPHRDLPSPFPPGPAPAGWRLHPESPMSVPGAASPQLSGPWPSDSLFHRAASGEFDLVVALYHDQGLIPIKLLEPTRAVNLTLGLPFIRTSPDHGTAFDKAGKGVADSRNFLEAAALAVRLAGRAHHQFWTAQVAAP